jgi:hypothetical protein
LQPLRVHRGHRTLEEKHAMTKNDIGGWLFTLIFAIALGVILLVAL